MTTKERNNVMYDVTAELDSIFGEPGTESRRAAEDLAWQEYNAQILLDARKKAGLTQAALAERIGASKGYISRIERGLTIPTISTFYRIVAAMGLAVELRPA
ncbi:MAG: helix-turn-helix domain-containing protein [Paludibacteraceae bacterium]|nr:helix-turn-helix domain-containing protein [Paludibacteraceae bacterium]